MQYEPSLVYLRVTTFGRPCWESRIFRSPEFRDDHHRNFCSAYRGRSYTAAAKVKESVAPFDSCPIVLRAPAGQCKDFATDQTGDLLCSPESATSGYCAAAYEPLTHLKKW